MRGDCRHCGVRRQKLHATALNLSRALSPSTPPPVAGDWLEGFIGSSGQILLHDHTLRAIIDSWLVSLGEQEFTNLLPMLRRVFSSFDRSERRRLLDEIAKLRSASSICPGLPDPVGAALAGPEGKGSAPGFAAALPLLLTILGASPESTGDGAP